MSGGVIEVLVNTAINCDGTVKIIISVIDQGIGINETDMANLFKAYFKTTDQRSEEVNVSSHGLGLYICHQISEAMKGEISVKS